jgi:hypothetical protein
LTGVLRHASRPRAAPALVTHGAPPSRAGRGPVDAAAAVLRAPKALCRRAARSCGERLRRRSLHRRGARVR